MKFSYPWLKEILKFKESPKKLAELLTLFAFETEVIKSGQEENLDVKILANRLADCSGHLGLAREISALLKKKFIFPSVKIKKSKTLTKKFLKVKINTPYCRCYLSRLIKGVRVGHSPSWMQKRLISCGIRPINNLVDAANYVMLETGQPLHIFDYDKINYSVPMGRGIPFGESSFGGFHSLSKGKNTPAAKIKGKTIIIRQAKPGEKITTLENKTYLLDEQVMIIADAFKPLAIAGIKGGKGAEITAETTNIVLESANFVGSNIRQSSQKLKIFTDASLRFEHNLNQSLAEYGLERLTELIKQISGGEILAMNSVIRKKQSRENWFSLEWNEVRKYLGWEITKKDIIKFLSYLGFELKVYVTHFLAKPPIFRQDIIFKEDIMGEIARLFGFNKIPLIYPKEFLKIPSFNKTREIKEEIKNLLKGLCLNEVYHYAFISENDKNNLPSLWRKELITIQNPTSSLMKFLRPTTFLAFLKNINQNFSFTDELKFFEIGKIYYQKGNSFAEKEVLAGILARKNQSGEAFYEVRGLIDFLLNNLGLEINTYHYSLLTEKKYQSIFSPLAAELRINQEIFGVIGEPNKALKKNFKINGEVIFWEIFLEPLLKLIKKEKVFQSLPKYPSVVRDISLLVKKEIPLGEVSRVFQNISLPYLKTIELLEVYQGKNLAPDKKSLTFSLTFQAANRTLTNEEIDGEIRKIYQVLEEKLAAKIR